MRLFLMSVLSFVLAAAPAFAAGPLKFPSSEEYVRICAGGAADNDCKTGFVAASNWVRFNSDTSLCLPDLKTSYGSKEFDAAVNSEIGGVAAWLKGHPESAHLDYVQSLGEGLIALYACKP